MIIRVEHKKINFLMCFIVILFFFGFLLLLAIGSISFRRELKTYLIKQLSVEPVQINSHKLLSQSNTAI